MMKHQYTTRNVVITFIIGFIAGGAPFVFMKLLQDMLCCGGMQPETAWRIAAQAWLQMKGYITVSINGKVSPYFC